jgi:hypothetical protein
VPTAVAAPLSVQSESEDRFKEALPQPVPSPVPVLMPPDDDRLGQVVILLSALPLGLPILAIVLYCSASSTGIVVAAIALGCCSLGIIGACAQLAFVSAQPAGLRLAASLTMSLTGYLVMGMAMWRNVNRSEFPDGQMPVRIQIIATTELQREGR